MLWPADLRADGQSDPLGSCRGQVVAGNLPIAVRLRLLIDLSPVELQVFDECFLANLAKRSSQRIFARLYHTLREIPVAIRAQHQKDPSRRTSPDNRHSRGEPML